MNRLDGRVAVVVGAGSLAEGWGNGKASAVSYAREGASVVCVDFHLERAQETATLIESEGGRAIALAADATDEADMNGVIERTLSEYGQLDVMHNNVGVGGSHGLPDQIPPEAWNREIAQNLTSAYMGIRCAAPVMREQGRGSIINISSLLAVRFLRHPNVGYTAAKAGVDALTRACAAGYGRHNIRVNCIRIGFSETPLVLNGLEGRGLTEEQKETEMAKSRRKVPLNGEHGNAFDVAATAVFLASDESKHITGAIVDVDGGLNCAPI